MGEEKIHEAVVFGDATFQLLNGTLSRLFSIVGPNGERFDLEVVIPGTATPISVKRFVQEISATSALLQEIENVPALLVPDAYVIDLASDGGRLRTTIDQLHAETEAFMSAGSVVQVDAPNLVVTNSVRQTFNIAPHLSGIRSVLQSFVIRILLIRSAASGSSAVGRNLAEEVAATRAEQRVTQIELDQFRDTLKKGKESIDALVEHAREVTEAAIADRKRVDAEHVTAKAANVEVQNAIANINVAAETAGKLLKAVESYQERFDTFSEALEERERAFAQDQKESVTLHAELTRSEGELSRLLDRARAVLGEATVAGLSDRFAKEERALIVRLRWSQGLFFFGTILFIFSAGAALDAFPWLSAQGWVAVHIKEAPISAELWPNLVYLLSSVIGKILLLLPALFLIAFSAKWYSALFRMRGEYSYKYTVAASLPGFKIEAPAFADAITAIAFQELLYNPEQGKKGLDPEDEAPIGNSWLQRLLEPIVKKSLDTALDKIQK